MKKLWLDFDNTVFDSTKAFLKAYNIMVEDTKKENSLYWNFNDANVKPEYIQQIFNSGLFFSYLKPYDGAIEVIKELSQITDVSFVTIGTYENIKTKIWLLQEVLKLSDNIGMIPIISPSNKPVIMNKSIIQDGILVDDNPTCLFSCWAEHKVLFSWQDKPYDWQKDYTPQYKMTAWDDKGYELLLKLIKGEE